MNADLKQALAQGIETLGLQLPPASQQKMLHLLALIQKWNKVYNLTAIRDPSEMVTHHLLDSLAVLPHMWPERWLDVGCGPGFPGLVLALSRPDWRFTLLDSNSKKTSFVQQAIIELQLQNAVVQCARAEEWAPDICFDGIISRAFAETAGFVASTRHLLARSGGWLAMKGRLDKDIMPLPDGVKRIEKIAIQVPGLAAARSLVVLKLDQP
jgi:16S rRNA (guanine527-N7)-methyltransferase